MIIKAATLPKFIHNWRVCWFLTKHPSRQTEQLQAIVFIVLIYDLKRSKDKDFTKTRDLKELHLRAKWLPRKLNLVHENNDNECVCLSLFSIFDGVWTLLQSIVIEDESSFQVQPTTYNLPPEPFVLYYF